MAIHRFAIIDCGTNTFHLLICEKEGPVIYPYFRDKVHVKIGEGGIEKQIIADHAYKRALSALEYFKAAIHKFEVEKVYATATSAIRNAKNGENLIKDIFDLTGIQVQIISGDKEAELIYKGVALAHSIGPESSLIVDIGGGSVECIIAHSEGYYWKRSYEIGAQRLLDRFHRTDPMNQSEVEALNHYLKITLGDLLSACKEYQVSTLIGSSGSFDTLYEMYARKKKLKINSNETSFRLSVGGFDGLHKKLLSKNKEERLKIPGMAEARVDMIVVASILINFLIKSLNIDRIIVSSFALKEGIMVEINQGIEKFD